MSVFDGIWKFLAGRVSKSRASRIMSALSVPYGIGSFGNNLWADNRFEQVRQFKSWTYVAIDVIAKKVAQLSPEVATISRAQLAEKHQRYHYKGLTRRQRLKALTQLSAAEDLEPVGQNHPLLRLLRNPNQPDTQHRFMRELTIFLYL